MSSSLDLRFSGRRLATRSQRRAGYRPRQKAAENALITKARKFAEAQRPKPAPAAPPSPAPQAIRETPEQRLANDQLASRGSVVRIDTHNIQYRLHVEQSTPTALLRRHYRGTPRGMRQEQGA